MKFKLIDILHIFIVVIIMASLIFSVWNINHWYKLGGIHISEIRTIYIFDKLFIVVLKIIAFIGVFLKKPVSWYIITQYFYFIFFNVFIREFQEQEMLGIESVTILIVILSIIVFCNHSKITDFYKFKSFNFLPNNLIAATIGFAFSMIF